MTGREERKSNDLFFTCSLIDYIARKTQNKRADVVTTLGRDSIAKIYELADVYHSDNIERVSDDLIESAHIPTGCFDNLSNSRYSIPSHWDIGKVYMDIVDALFAAYQSFVSDLIEDFNSSFYYDAPQNILNAYLRGSVIPD